MKIDWKMTTLGKCGQWLSGGTPSKDCPDFWNGNIPWISAKSMYSIRIGDSEDKITVKGSKDKTRRVPPKTILILVRGSMLLQRIPIGITTREVTFNQDVKAIIPAPHLFPEFLLYWLLANESILQNIVEFTGIGAGKLPTDRLQNMPLSLPPLPEQKAIAHILGTLDDKIELNQQMNQTLEAMAKAIFKSWFVDFDPVRAKMEGKQPVGMDAATAELFPDSFEESELGLIPQGWRVEKLGNLAKNFSKSFDFLKKDKVIFINTGDVLSGKFLHNNLISKEGLPGQAKKSIDKNDILFSEIRPANQRYAFVDFDARNYVVSTKFMIIRALEDIEPRLLYRILILKNTLAEFQIVAESRSGTFPQITFESISYFPIILTPKVVQKAFLTMINSFEKQIWQNENQNYALTIIRDTLLPKLMSGEIRVKEAERILKEVV